jgi:hypothetical protein
MAIKTLVTASLVILAVWAAPVAQVPQTPSADGYAWSDSCRSCHEAIYDAWARTKHASALDRLSSANQEEPCVGCHVTGPKTRVMDGRKVLTRGVQCEACHGAAAQHAANTSVTGIVKTPPESSCTGCHSDKSPHFKGFFYAGMASLSHKVR